MTKRIEESIALSAFAAAIALFIAGIQINAAPSWYLAPIFFFIVSAIAISDLSVNAINHDRFKSRIVEYIAEAEQIIANQSFNTYSKTTAEYLGAMHAWSDKVAEDIKKNKGTSEMSLFLDELETQGTFSLLDGESDPMKRVRAAQIVSIRLNRLKELQKRYN